jgi:hypothetical protein
MRFALVFGVQLLYVVCAAGLAVYSLHALWLVWQVRKAVYRPARSSRSGLRSPCSCPFLTNDMWRPD